MKTSAWRRLAPAAAAASALGLAWACVHGGGGNGGSDSAGPFGADEPRGGEIGDAFLWRVTPPKASGALGATAASPSWLFGTVHVGVDAEKDLSKGVWAAFRASPCFVMESDPSAMSPTEVVSLSRLPEGERLPAKLEPAVWTKVKERLGGALPQPLLEGSAPWFVTILYLQAIAPDAGAPMDGLLHTRAQSLGKRIEYLEDWREAMSAFASVTGPEDLEDLALHEEKALGEIETMLAAYRSGDEAELTRVMDDINEDTPNGDLKLRVLMDERNGKWLPRLTDTLARAPKGGCFVAVGAGHLVGKNNLRDRLAASGYETRRATPADTESLEERP
jgi:uncharacterized protein YbaP (TraB family)